MLEQELAVEERLDLAHEGHAPDRRGSGAGDLRSGTLPVHQGKTVLLRNRTL